MPSSQDAPWVALLQSVGIAGLAGYLFWMWLGDLSRARKGEADPRAFPGATTCPQPVIWLAVAGALALLALETWGEYTLGISEEQSDIAVVALLPMIAAAFGEELVVRGFLVVTGKGRATFITSISGFSLLFALAHPFLWHWKEVVEGEGKTLVWDFSLKAWWSMGMVFAFSLWMYAARFVKLNPRQSLIPCIAGHLAKNVGVFGIKLAQGHVIGWW